MGQVSVSDYLSTIPSTEELFSSSTTSETSSNPWNVNDNHNNDLQQLQQKQQHHHDIFLNRVMTVIASRHDMINWGLKFATFWEEVERYIRPPPKPDNDPTVKFQLKTRGHGRLLCQMHHKFSKNSKRIYPQHILIDGMDSNWGALSASIENKTVAWGTVEEWPTQRGCSREEMLQHLSRPKMLGLITVQHHYDIDHPKAHSIPIGFYDQAPFLESFLKKIRRGEVSYEKTCNNNNNKSSWLTINFSNYASRPGVAKALDWAGPNTYSPERTRHDVLEEMYCSKFVASPSGMGLDCYRTWEALVLGRIPILERQTVGMGGMKRIYDELPILWVDQWEDITEDLLRTSWLELSQKLDTYNFERLTKQYWLDFIKSMIPTDV